jgi:N-acetylmuramic acid 6-phosphate etherase
MTARAGCSYFGVRILRHVRRDLEDIAARGYTDVLHTFSENDLAYYRGTMADIVAASHELGLAVQMAPWGLGRTFGGEAESRFVTMRPEACQVLDDGRRVATGCLNNETYRAFCRDWADAAIEVGADRVFWDEPHWTVPEHVGIADSSRWACRCDVCRGLFEERHGEPMPSQLVPEVLAFREASLVDFLRDMLAHVSSRGGRSTICLLPLVEGSHGVSDWDAVASLPGLDTLATDPYWKNFDEEPSDFVGRFARLVSHTAAQHSVGAQLWVPSFGLTREDVPDLEAAIASARAAGIDDLWTWGYEACGHMTHLATPDSPLVWEAVTRALTGSLAVTERERVELRDLDLRATLELVRVINSEDETVAGAVAAAAPELAAAIDAIVERLRGGGRLIYVGAGTSGGLAALDAAECGPTFSAAPGQIVALAVAQEAAEDDAEAGAAAVDAVDVTAADAVVGVSASGRTQYTLGALRRAAEAGALTVAVACVRGSELARAAAHAIEVEVGPEVIAGSTRMKAGTAQKLVLNTISTVAMVRLGKTFGNLMVDVQASNEKLRARARRAVALATGSSEDEVDEALAAAGGEVKVAIVALAAGVDAETARARLTEAGGAVRQALQEPADVVG